MRPSTRQSMRIAVVCFALLCVMRISPSLATHTLSPRQAATADANTIGTASAQAGAAAAGNSIGTGAGGARGTPDSPQGFARLLSGVFFGGLLTLMFGGALFVQSLHYFARYGRWTTENRVTQTAVWLMLLFSLVQDGAVLHRLYSIHVAHFGDFAFPLLTVGLELCISFGCIAMNTGIAQVYFAHRVWKACGKKVIILLVYSVLISFTFAGGIASAVLLRMAGSAADVKGHALSSFMPTSRPWQFSVVFATWLCSSVVIDVSLCFSLVWQLRKMSTPFFPTRYAVARLLKLSLQTCIGTATVSIAAMALFVGAPSEFFYLIPFLPLGQIMASSLLVTLMSRPSLGRDRAQEQAAAVQLHNTEAAGVPSQSRNKPIVDGLLRHGRRRTGDMTGVLMTTTMEALVQDGNDEYGWTAALSETEKLAQEKHNRMAEGGGGGVDTYTFDELSGMHVFKPRTAKNGDDFRKPFSHSTSCSSEFGNRKRDEAAAGLCLNGILGDHYQARNGSFIEPSDVPSFSPAVQPQSVSLASGRTSRNRSDHCPLVSHSRPNTGNRSRANSSSSRPNTATKSRDVNFGLADSIYSQRFSSTPRAF